MPAIGILLLSTAMVMVTSLLYYEILRITWDRLPSAKGMLRLRILWVIIAIFAGHTIAVWLYALIYWFVLTYFPTVGTLQGTLEHNFTDILYFSASTYSSLGYGDIFVTGPLRMMAGIEVLNGLVMIGWSASFTYLAMEKFWDLHKRK